MVNYPVPPIVTQAKVQLLIDETAKAAKATIIQDLAKIVEVQKQVELNDARIKAGVGIKLDLIRSKTLLSQKDLLLIQA